MRMKSLKKTEYKEGKVESNSKRSGCLFKTIADLTIIIFSALLWLAANAVK